MQRLEEIQTRINWLEQELDKQHPRFRADKNISNKITELKEYALAERKKYHRELKEGRLTDFEKRFIGPAIDDVYMKAIDKMRKGAKPSVELCDHVSETASTLSWWLCEIEHALSESGSSSD